MKILFLTNELKNTCGVTSHLYNLCIGLQRNGIDFKIACGGGDSIQRFKSEGISIIIIKELLHEKRNIIHFITAHVKLFIHIINVNYDLVHSHHHYCANIAKNVCRILSIKTVQTNHGILPNVGLLKHFSADYFIAVNDHIYDYLVSEEKISSERISIIYNGIWGKENKTKEQHKKIKFIAAARLVEEKGIQDYIKAVHLLQEDYFKQAEFFFGGEGAYENVLRKLNEELGLKIVFLGNISNLNERFDEFDVFVMTSKSKSEGLLMTMIEAAFAGCLIISSNYYGINKLFNYDSGCITYECGDYVSLTHKLANVIDNSDDVILLTKKLHKIIIKNFNADTMTQKTIHLYSKIIND